MNKYIIILLFITKNIVCLEPKSSKKELPKYIINAINNSQVKPIERYLYQNGDINAFGIFEDQEGKKPIKKTMLMQACWHGDIDIVNFLLNKGADINITNPNKYTALIYAIVNNHKEIIKLIKLLIKRGANVQFDDLNNGVHPIGFAVFYGRLDIVKELTHKGASIYVKNKGGETLKEVALKGNKEWGYDTKSVIEYLNKKERELEFKNMCKLYPEIEKIAQELDNLSKQNILNTPYDLNKIIAQYAAVQKIKQSMSDLTNTDNLNILNNKDNKEEINQKDSSCEIC